MVVQPSLVAIARHEQHQRTAPPPVPPLVEQSAFETKEEYAAYMKERRKAQERVREYNRPARTGRVRPAREVQPSATSKALAEAVSTLKVRRRRIMFGRNVETGRKSNPSTANVEICGLANVAAPHTTLIKPGRTPA